uniref:Lipoyl synthase n=1 Tax=candidate division WOR-3 bacterium TaxID=2052148 RepID=A0A7C3Z2J3_UNCW3
MKPSWLKTNLPGGEGYSQLVKILKDLNLNTVCREAHCPNLGECFGQKTATFMILGKVCTRHCQFCSVESGRPEKVDREEPTRIAEAVRLLNLKYVVITSVTRDDLPDGGAEHFAETVRRIRENNKDCRIELLIPDFLGKEESLLKVMAVKPDVIAHNLETTKSLSKIIRDKKADYDRSLFLLRFIKERSRIKTKSGLMIGLGESWEEIILTLKDLSSVGVDIVTVGQYLPSNKKSPQVKRFYTEKEFKELKEAGERIGFLRFFAGPLVRSSYQAERIFS